VIPSLVFDNSPLSHFARAAQLDLLASLVRGHDCVTTSEVRTELLTGTAEHPELANALALPWLRTVELTDITELTAFARFKSELGGGPSRNVGEATTLAWAKSHTGIIIMDERAGSRIAQREEIEVHGSLWLVTNGLRSGLLDRSEAEDLVDSLADTGMRLPVDGKRLFAWAYESGLLP
jgi:predicted nucleic acid-binding protein